tara:strand:- start:555 stop:845 length:291 start_codon:yes stop_codon:yes gene_type:complete
VSSVVWLTSAQNKGGSMDEDTIQKQLQHITDSSRHATWQGGIFALENLKRTIDSEILKLKNLCDSTDIGKTLNRVAEATVKAMEEEKERRKNESNI